MVRVLFAASVILGLLCPGYVRADDKDKELEELRAKILKKVEERLKAENKRVMDEVKKILDEELAKLAEEEEEEEEEPPKKPEPKKPEPKKPEPKKPEPKKPEPKKPELKQPESKPADDEPGYMGVYPEDLREGMRSLLKLAEDEGVLIVGVAEEGPAAKAGVKANDIVVAVDGKKVGDAETLREMVTGHKAGESVKLTVLRKKERMDIKVKLAARSSIPGMDEDEPPAEDEEEEDEEEEKPAKKPKVIFEPRADSPKLDDMTEEELREATKKFLDENLEEEKPAKKAKLLVPRSFGIGLLEDEEEFEEEEPSDEDPQEGLRELTKRLLKEILEGLEEGREQMPFDFDEELEKMMEKLEDFKGEEFDALKEKFQEQMEKLGDEDFLKKLLEGMNPEMLEEQLRRLMGGGEEQAPDEEDLTDPEEGGEEEAPAQPEQPKAPRRVSRVWLGVAPDELTDEMKEQLNVEKGVVVREVTEESPAAEAGLKEGDIILSIDGKAVAGPDALREMLAGEKPGATVVIQVLRKGKKIDKQVTLAARRKSSVIFRSEPIGDERHGKKEASKKKDEKRKTSRVLESGPAEFGFDFAKKQGWKLGLVDRNGKVIFSQPMDNARALAQMAERFGFPLAECDEPCCRGKKKGRTVERVIEFKNEGPARIFGLGDDDEKPRKKAKKKIEKKQGRRPADRLFHDGDDHDLRRLFEKHGEDFRRHAELARKQIEKAMKEHHDFEFDFEMPRERIEKAHREFGRRLKLGEREFEGARKEFEKALKGRKQAQELFRKSAPRKPKVEKVEKRFVFPKDGGDLRDELEKVRRELERAMKERKGMPKGLREDIEELQKDIEEMFRDVEKKKPAKKKGF